MAAHRFFDHTGDFGVELEADDLAGLYAEVATGFAALLTGDGGSIAERESRLVHVGGVDEADLLVALGNELVFLFETEGFLPARLEVSELGARSIAAVVHGEPYDPKRHVIARPIKAVTHHGAETLEREGRLRVRLLFDL